MEIVEMIGEEVKKLEEKVKEEVERVESGAEKVLHEAEDVVKRIEGALVRKVEKISAVADDPPRSATEERGGRKTFPSFLAKVMAEAESGADAKQIDKMLSGLTVEQRVAVKMQMVKAGMM